MKPPPGPGGGLDPCSEVLHGLPVHPGESCNLVRELFVSDVTWSSWEQLSWSRAWTQLPFAVPKEFARHRISLFRVMAKGEGWPCWCSLGNPSDCPDSSLPFSRWVMGYDVGFLLILGQL